MSKNALIPHVQKKIFFYGDQIVAVQLDNEEVFVPIRQMCDLLGISYQGQIDRIRRDPVLSKYESQILVESSGGKRGGGAQAANCIALKYIPGWLFGINANRVKEKVRQKLVLYQEQVYDVIWRAFQDEVEPAEMGSLDRIDSLDELAVIEQMGLAIYRLARQQRAMEARLENVEDAVWEIDERTQREIEQVKQQLSALELRLTSPTRSRTISEQQAAELSQAVKTLAMALGKKSGRNEFGAIYGELYRRFGITSYRNLPAAAYQEAMEWLETWFRNVVEEEPEGETGEGDDQS